MKIIKVSCCGQCPQKSLGFNNGKPTYFCHDVNITEEEYPEIPDVKLIPLWCPLEDMPEDKESK